jgi:hypothetical protein
MSFPGAPHPEIDVSDTFLTDFRHAAEPAIHRFVQNCGRYPNYLGVRLSQVETVEKDTGWGGITAYQSVPLLFTGR